MTMDDAEYLLAFGREHGLAALFDHLGLDEFGNDVTQLETDLIQARRERDEARVQWRAERDCAAEHARAIERLEDQLGD